MSGSTGFVFLNLCVEFKKNVHTHTHTLSLINGDSQIWLLIKIMTHITKQMNINIKIQIKTYD